MPTQEQIDKKWINQCVKDMKKFQRDHKMTARELVMVAEIVKLQNG